MRLPTDSGPTPKDWLRRCGAIGEEVASPQDLQRVLDRPDDRGEVQGRIRDAAGQPLAPRHGSDGGDCDHRPEERNRSDELPRYPPLPVPHRAR